MNAKKLAQDIRGEIEKATGEKAAVSVKDSIVKLSGRFRSPESTVDAGHIAAGFEGIR